MQALAMKGGRQIGRGGRKGEGDDAQWAQREEEENQEWGRVEREREEFRRPRRRSVILTLQMQVDGRTDAECLFHLASFDRPDRQTNRQTTTGERLVGEGKSRRDVGRLRASKVMFNECDDWSVTSADYGQPTFKRIAS